MTTNTLPGSCELAYLRGEKVRVEEHETVELLKQSSSSRPVQMAFGVQGCFLEPVPHCRWAYLALDKIREGDLT